MRWVEEVHLVLLVGESAAESAFISNACDTSGGLPVAFGAAGELSLEGAVEGGDAARRGAETVVEYVESAAFLREGGVLGGQVTVPFTLIGLRSLRDVRMAAEVLPRVLLGLDPRMPRGADGHPAGLISKCRVIILYLENDHMEDDLRVLLEEYRRGEGIVCPVAVRALRGASEGEVRGALSWLTDPTPMDSMGLSTTAPAKRPSPGS